MFRIAVMALLALGLAGCAATERSPQRYAMVTGVRGSAANTQTVYIVDDVNQILYAFEYHSRAKEMKYRDHSDIYLFAGKLAELRQKAERKKGRE